MGTPRSSAERHRLKLREVLRRHEECQIAFQELKSQILFGLSEAKDVFNSLSVPLMRLVGLKTEEMAEEGSSSSIFVDRHLHASFPSVDQQSNGSAPGGFVLNGDLLRKADEDGIYTAKARETCEALEEKQKLNVRTLVSLLRAIERHVNSRHDTVRRNLDSHRDSLRNFFKRAASLLINLHGKGQAYDSIVQLAGKILRVTFDQVGATLESLEDEVDSLVKGLSEEISGPLVGHARSLWADVKNGAPALMAALVGDMERALRDRREVVAEMERVAAEARLEAEVARKRARLEENQKQQAVRVSREYQEKFRGLREFVVKSFLRAREDPNQVNLLHPAFGDKRSSLIVASPKDQALIRNGGPVGPLLGLCGSPSLGRPRRKRSRPVLSPLPR